MSSFPQGEPKYDGIDLSGPPQSDRLVPGLFSLLIPWQRPGKPQRWAHEMSTCSLNFA